MGLAPQFQWRKDWNLDRFRDTLYQRNTGERAVRKMPITGETCVYETEGGNHCAVGCFIPEGHSGMACRGDATDLFFHYPYLARKMPLNRKAMLQLQKAHDRYEGDRDVREVLIDWVLNNVKGAREENDRDD